jgi:hypothetical protein
MEAYDYMHHLAHSSTAKKKKKKKNPNLFLHYSDSRNICRNETLQL